MYFNWKGYSFLLKTKGPKLPEQKKGVSDKVAAINKASDDYHRQHFGEKSLEISKKNYEEWRSGKSWLSKDIFDYFSPTYPKIGDVWRIYFDDIEYNTNYPEPIIITVESVVIVEEAKDFTYTSGGLNFLDTSAKIRIIPLISKDSDLPCDLMSDNQFCVEIYDLELAKLERPALALISNVMTLTLENTLQKQGELSTDDFLVVKQALVKTDVSVGALCDCGTHVQERGIDPARHGNN